MTIKVYYDKKIPKSRLRTQGLCGVAFDLDWDRIVQAVQNLRVKNGLADAHEITNNISDIRVTDKGVTFRYGNDYKYFPDETPKKQKKKA